MRISKKPPARRRRRRKSSANLLASVHGLRWELQYLSEAVGADVSLHISSSQVSESFRFRPRPRPPGRGHREEFKRRRQALKQISSDLLRDHDVDLEIVVNWQRQRYDVVYHRSRRHGIRTPGVRQASSPCSEVIYPSIEVDDVILSIDGDVERNPTFTETPDLSIQSPTADGPDGHEEVDDRIDGGNSDEGDRSDCDESCDESGDSNDEGGDGSDEGSDSNNDGSEDGEDGTDTQNRDCDGALLQSRQTFYSPPPRSRNPSLGSSVDRLPSCAPSAPNEASGPCWTSDEPEWGGSEHGRQGLPSENSLPSAGEGSSTAGEDAMVVSQLCVVDVCRAKDTSREATSTATPALGFLTGIMSLILPPRK